MNVKCPNCNKEFALDEVIKSRLAGQLSAEIEGNVRAEAEASARLHFEKTLKALQDTVNTLNAKIAKDSEEYKQLYRQLTDANLAKDEAEKNAEKRIMQETEIMRAQIKNAVEDEYRVKLEAKDRQIKQIKDELKTTQETAERGSQQLQGEALEQLTERDLRDACRADKIETVKTGVRGADILQTVIGTRGEQAGVILWEVKNAKWQPAWVQKFKEDMAAKKAALGVLVVQDLPEPFGDFQCVAERIFAIKPRLVKPIANAFRERLLAVHDIAQTQKFSGENIEAFYKYLTSGEFKGRLAAVLENYKSLRDAHEKDKEATFRRLKNFDKLLDKIFTNAANFVGELQGISGGEIGDIPLLADAGVTPDKANVGDFF